MERFFGPPEGNLEASIQETEARLGVELPALLRQLYRGTGRMMELWDSRARGGWKLVGLGGLELSRDVLVFAHEQQGCAAWGMRPGQPERLLYSDDDATWHGCEETPRDFLRHLVMWHSALAFDWEGGVERDASAVRELVAGWDHERFVTPLLELDFYCRRRTVLAVDWHPAGRSTVMAGGSDPVELADHLERLGIALPGRCEF